MQDEKGIASCELQSVCTRRQECATLREQLDGQRSSRIAAERAAAASRADVSAVRAR